MAKQFTPRRLTPVLLTDADQKALEHAGNQPSYCSARESSRSGPHREGDTIHLEGGRGDVHLGVSAGSRGGHSYRS